MEYNARARNHNYMEAMEAERCTFLDLFRSCTFRQSPLVVDCRRKSPIVAARRRLSPIRDRKIRATKKKFANYTLWPTCAKCACEKLTFELSLDNDIKQPQDGPFGW